MPDRFYVPSGWLGAFAGPPGPLAAVFGVEREGLFGSEPGVVGVSAIDGSYGFVELPGEAVGRVLSPDGARLAFWITGAPSVQPNPPDEERTVTGYGVLDLTSGKVARFDIPTEHGLSADSDGLAWADKEALVVVYGQYRAWKPGVGTTSTFSKAWIWRPGTAPRPLRGHGEVGTDPGVVGHGMLLYEGRPHDVLYDTVTGESRPVSGRTVSGWPPGPAVSPGGRLFAGIPGSSLPSQLRITNDAGAVVAAPEGIAFAALWWPDNHRLVAYRPVYQVPLDRMGDRSCPAVEDCDYLNLTLDLFDLRTGRWTTLVTDLNDEQFGLQYPRIAVGLLAGPTRPGVAPPSPASRRVIAGGSAGAGALVVILGATALVLWRRRSREGVGAAE